MIDTQKNNTQMNGHHSIRLIVVPATNAIASDANMNADS